MRRLARRLSARPFSTCPIHYRYGPQKIAQATVEKLPDATLYVVGGLYGNRFALDAFKSRVAAEKGAVYACFNGDFNFLNGDEQSWVAVNQAILFENPNWSAILGNVEYEAAVSGDFTGCGCGYPEYVSPGVPERSDLIVKRLRAAARKRPDIQEHMRSLPFFRVYHLGELRVAVIHGDPESLAGWGLAPETTEPRIAGLQDALGIPEHHPMTSEEQLHQWLQQANVDVFASTHTCIPFAQRVVGNNGDTRGLYFNNGSAGMGNFKRTTAGLVTRISTDPTVPEDSLYGTTWKGVRFDAVPVCWDTSAHIKEFESHWPPGSPAFISYANRIRNGLSFYTVGMANRL